jgi:hypothetical protein
VANFERSKAFRDLVAVVEAEFAARDMSLKTGAAREMMSERVEYVARQMAITPQAALKKFTPDGVREMARTTVRALKEHQARQDALPPVQLSAEHTGRSSPRSPWPPVWVS